VTPPAIVLRVVAILALILEFWMGAILIPRALNQNVDFCAYYYAGTSLRTNPQNLYELRTDCTPFIHPAYEAAFFLPFSFFSYRTAFLLFLGLNLILLMVIWKVLPLPWEVAAFAPLSVTLVFGQDSILLLVLLCAAWAACRGRNPVHAGFYLGLAMFRFQNIVPILILLAIWKEWNILKGTAIATAIVATASSMIISPSRYIAVLMSLSFRSPARYVQPLERMTNLRGLIHALLPTWEPYLLSAAILTILATAAWLGWRQSSETRLAIALLATSLASYHFYGHDLSTLLISLAALWVERNSPKVYFLFACLIGGSVFILFNWQLYWFAGFLLLWSAGYLKVTCSESSMELQNVS
jgi:hypothetical protein